jgi:hypothetical protein
MTKSHSTKARIGERAPFALQAPIISHDDSQQDPAGQRTLYVLGFGIAGASEHARFHLFRLVLRVRLISLYDITTLFLLEISKLIHSRQ